MTLNNRFSNDVSRITAGRRLFLKETLSCTAVALAVNAGILLPVQASASWNEIAFHEKNLQTAIKSALGSDLSEASNKISIKVPDTAENGAIVPITVSSSLEDVSTITIFSEQNNMPLVAQFELDKDCDALISTRIKMSKTSNVIAIVSAGGKNYSTRKEVKVSIGGCGS